MLLTTWRLALYGGTVTLHYDRSNTPLRESTKKEGTAMILALEIVGAAASVITIFTAGIAVGRFIEHSKNDRR